MDTLYTTSAFPTFIFVSFKFILSVIISFCSPNFQEMLAGADIVKSSSFCKLETETRVYVSIAFFM